MLIVENRDYILTQYAKFLLHLFAQNKIAVFQFWNHPQRKPIWYTRRKMIEEALAKPEITHVLFVDTDVVPPLDFLDRLIAHDKDMVSGVYYDCQQRACSRKDGKVFDGEGLEEVDTFAMGLSLISRKVLEDVKYPDPEPSNKTDADDTFCKHAREKGYTIYQDFSLRAPHLLLGIQ